MSDTNQRIADIVGGKDVVLFMKGTPLFPQCGFSSRAVAILDHCGVAYDSVDVLQDMEVRQGIKAYSDWPTIPQLYVKGEFVGGSDIMMEMFEAGEFDVCTLYYNKFISALTQEVTPLQLIPFTSVGQKDDEDQDSGIGDSPYGFEPDEEAILEALLPKNLAVQVYRSLLESFASEQGARMTAMDNATRNAGDMINSLSITYNRARQAMITKELIEIISGAEAL